MEDIKWNYINILSSIKNVHVPVGILLRHSIRREITDARDAHDLTLTEEGKVRARDFARLIPFSKKLVYIYYSHSPRCVETGKIIHDELGLLGCRSYIKGPNEFLSCPFIKDSDKVMSMINTIGAKSFINQWLTGKIDEGIIEAYDSAISKLFTRVLSEMSYNGDALSLFITHDLSIVPMVNLIKDINVEDFPWPGYLDGVVVYINKDGIILKYHDWNKTVQLLGDEISELQMARL